MAPTSKLSRNDVIERVKKGWLSLVDAKTSGISFTKISGGGTLTAKIPPAIIISVVSQSLSKEFLDNQIIKEDMITYTMRLNSVSSGHLYNVASAKINAKHFGFSVKKSIIDAFGNNNID